MKFWKMHGVGNDFVVFDARTGTVPETTDWARAICDRHAGIGCDQIVIIKPPRNSDAYTYIRFLNADGSEPESCGNGTRCAAALLAPELALPQFQLETLGGMRAIDATDPDLITVDMGHPRTEWRDIPLAAHLDTNSIVISVPGFHGDAVCTSMGNPHATFFVLDIDQIDLAQIGPAIEHHPLFPQRVNVGFARMQSRNRMYLKVWERGSGHTLACGSATCAAAVAAIRRGVAERRIVVEVELGQLTVEWRGDGSVLLGGPTALVFTGDYPSD